MSPNANIAALSFCLCISSVCLAQTTVLTSDTVISATNQQFEGQHLVIQGCTVAIDGTHTFAAVDVVRGSNNRAGVLTHSAGIITNGLEGVALSVTGDLTVEGPLGGLVGSRLDVSGKGHPARTGPGAPVGIGTLFGGAGHGGRGADSGNGAAGGTTYGSDSNPATFGSGGGGILDGTPGAGGGAMRLVVGGSLRLDGEIRADASGAGNNCSAGAGGSINIVAGSMSGFGLISAAGGELVSFADFGGGGGGRVAITCCDFAIPLDRISVPGGGTRRGQPGTVRLNTASIQIHSQPSPATVFAGHEAVFSVLAAAGTPLTYQWRRNGQALNDNARADGTHSSSLRIANADSADNGAYDVVIATASCSRISTAAQLVVRSDFHALGTLSGFTDSYATGLSSDGRAAVGYCLDGVGSRAFRWNTDDGLHAIGIGTDGQDCRAYATSADGLVVAGERPIAASNNLMAVAFQDQAFVPLGILTGGAYSRAWAVSGDGRVIVGESSASAATLRAFRWDAATGIRSLGRLPNGEYSVAFGISADGAVVTGQANTGPNTVPQLFRWTAGTGMQALGVLPGSSEARGRALNADGSVIVGASGHAFRWTSQTGFHDLGTLGGQTSEALSVDATGNRVVGRSDTAQGISRPFLWTPQGGMINIQDLFASQGILPSDWTLSAALNISADGNAVAGWGRNREGQVEGWVARLVPSCWADFNGDGSLNADDLGDFITGYFSNPVDPRTDWNGIGGVDADDLGDFITAYFAGCP